MRISTQISTQIILNQDELTEAIIEYIRARTELPDDSKFAVEFEDDVKNPNDLTAVVNITGTNAADEVSVAAVAKALKAKPETTRRAPTTVVKKPAEAAAPDESKPAISADPENRTDPQNPDDPPFDPDPPKEEVKEVLAVQDPPKEETKTEEAKPADKPTPKIFPQTSTSAPTPPAEEVDPAVKAKSLFANLTKPTN